MNARAAVQCSSPIKVIAVCIVRMAISSARPFRRERPAARSGSGNAMAATDPYQSFAFVENIGAPVSFFGKIFVAMNRVFGAFSLVTGILLVLGAVVRVSLYGPDKAFWTLGVAGVLLIPVGVLYLRAPLTRPQANRGRYQK